VQTGDALVGQVVAERYMVLQHLGSGGFGSVYMAKHTKLNNPVALKVLHPHLISNSEIIARFEREAEATSRLKHNAIASVHDIGCLEDGRPYMVMEYLSGSSLADLIELEGALTVERAVPLFVECCEALRYAHKKGLLHRDIKPDNIFITRDLDGGEHAKLLDFGLAKLVFGDDGNSLVNSLTESGIALGTPWYMSPEQCQAKPLDGRTDIYSLAYSLYEALAGRRPFPGRTHYEAMNAHLHTKVPRLNEEGQPPVVPEGLEAAILKALSKAPNDRFSTADEFRDALVATVPSASSLVRGTPQRAPLQLQQATLSGPAPGQKVAARRAPSASSKKANSDKETVIAAGAVLLAVGLAVGGLTWWHNSQTAKHAPAPVAVAPPVVPEAEKGNDDDAVAAEPIAKPVAVQAPMAVKPVVQTIVQPAAVAQPTVSQEELNRQIDERVKEELAKRQAATPQVVPSQSFGSGTRPQPAPETQAARSMPQQAPDYQPIQFPESDLRPTRYIQDGNSGGMGARRQPMSSSGEPLPAPDFSDRTGWDPRIPANWKPGDPLPPGVKPPKPNNWREGMPLPPEPMPSPFENH
jgi:serine/threonine-protein kinase